MKWWATLILAALLGPAVPARAQEALDLHQGDRVRIALADGGTRLTGRVLMVLPDSLRLSTAERPAGVWTDTAAWRTVELQVPNPSRRTPMLIGAAVGGALGLALAIAADSHDAACPVDGACDRSSA